MLKNLLESFRIFRIIFYEIAVQVIVSGISAKTVFFRSVLVGAAVFSSSQHSGNIIGLDCGDFKVFSRNFSGGQIAHQHHCGVNSIGFTRMNSVVDKDYWCIFIFRIIKNHYFNRFAVIIFPEILYGYTFEILIEILIIFHHFFISGGLVSVAFFVGSGEFILSRQRIAQKTE